MKAKQSTLLTVLFFFCSMGMSHSMMIGAEAGGSRSGRKARANDASAIFSASIEPDTSATGNAPLVAARDDTTASQDYSFGEMSIAGVSLNALNIYGYFATRLEKNWSVPALEGAQIVKASEPAAWTNPFFNVMLQHQTSQKFKIFVNLNGARASTIEVRNLWGEYSASNALNIRLGKSYRKFGLYNEILDAVPTYYGIEPPELFDADHLIISRTSIFMIYGGFAAGSGTLNYSLSTDNGEGGSDTFEENFPLGWDLNYKFGGGDYTLGLSGYSTAGFSHPDVALGSGSPKSGVLPWMANDRFSVFGGYAEGKFKNLTLQFEYWNSPHDAERDPAAVVKMINGANPNAAQLARFLADPNGARTEANVRRDGDYTVSTWYVRGGYAFETAIGEVGPYAQWDYYSNPETIASKSFGGDDEAGATDTGKFNKATVGLVFRPAPEVAVKLDYSAHIHKFRSGNESFPEVRLDVSYIFGQLF
jgi:hypothetical protein